MQTDTTINYVFFLSNIKNYVKNKLLNIPPVPAVLFAIKSVQSDAAIAKTLSPEIGAASNKVVLLLIQLSEY
jgi:threonine/homoserine efflux transporter RhtA